LIDDFYFDGGVRIEFLKRLQSVFGGRILMIYLIFSNPDRTTDRKAESSLLMQSNLM